MNASLAIYLQWKKTYLEFVRAIDLGHSKMRMKESKSEYSTMHTNPNPSTSLTEIEGHAVQIYTRKSFSFFQVELQKEALYRLREPVVEHSDGRVFHLGKYKHPDRSIKVEVDYESNSFNCECRRYESTGFPCRHQLACLKLMDFIRIPDTLIMHRWTKDAKLSVPPYVGGDVAPEVMQRMRFASLNSRSNRMNYLGSLTGDSFVRASGEIDRIMAELLESSTVVDPKPPTKLDTKVKDPAEKKSKGKQVLNVPKTARKCRNCKMEGHNKTTCPRLNLSLGPNQKPLEVRIIQCYNNLELSKYEILFFD
jgi:SWIM zinc finger